MESAGYQVEWGEPKTGGIFRAGLPVNVTSWNPSSSLSAAFSQPTALPIFNWLLVPDPWVGTSELIPDLAKSWDISSDGLQITFHLREGIKFQPNPNIPESLRDATFTCEDVQASIERLVRPHDWDRTNITDGPVILGHVNGVTCPDGAQGYTAVINLASTKAKTMRSLAYATTHMMDKDYIEQWLNLDPGPKGSRMDKGTNEAYMWLTGTGPFIPMEFTPDISIKNRRNPSYWKEGLPLVDGFDSFIVKDYTTRFTALATGQLHLFGHGSSSLLPGQVEQAERDFADRITVHSALYNLAYGNYINTTRAPWDDPRVAKAVYLAMDRDAWKVFQKAGSRDGTMLMGGGQMPGTFYSTPEDVLRTWPGLRQPKDEDIAEANRLLDEVFGEGERFSATCLTRNTQSYQDMCLFWADQMQSSLGIDASVEFWEGSVVTERLNSCAYDVAGQFAGATRTGDPDDYLFNYYHRSNASTTRKCPYTGMDQSILDQLEADIEAQSDELDPLKRRDMVRAIDKTLTLDVHLRIPYGWNVIFYGTSEKARGYFLMTTPYNQHALWDRVWIAD
jgi:ABC-type transport system substrate-binding protein